MSGPRVGDATREAAQTTREAAAATRQAAHWLRGCEVGTGAVVRGRRPTIDVAGRIRIGERFHLESAPVASHLITGPGATLSIGDDVHVGHGAAIAAFSGIAIGDRTRIGPYVIMMDTDFHAIGDRDVSYAGSPITIGRGVRVGSRVTILRGTVVHDGAELVAGSVVSGVVAAGARVAGVPARPVGVSVADEGGGVMDARVAVPAVVRRALTLAAEPAPADGPATIEQWDSLGALNLLLALEDAFGVTLDDADVAGATSVADLIRVVDAALARRAGADDGAETAAAVARR